MKTGLLEKFHWKICLKYNQIIHKGYYVVQSFHKVYSVKSHDLLIEKQNLTGTYFCVFVWKLRYCIGKHHPK